MIKNRVLTGVEAGRRHFRGRSNANSIADSLPKRSRGAFHSGRVAKFRVSRRFGMQLPEPFDFRHRQIIAAYVQPGIEKHAAVSAGENEMVAIDPARLVRIVFQRIAVEHRADFCAAERKPEVSRLRRLHGIHAQTACFVRRPRENFDI